MIVPHAALPADVPDIENLLDLAFGIGRRTKTCYRLREGNAPVPGLSLVTRDPALGLVGSISFWPLRIGAEAEPALLLGPLAVHPERQNLGIGLGLMRDGIERARALGHKLIILVGDAPYYARVGFKQIPQGRLGLPGTVDPKRFLYLELEPGAFAAARGLVLGAHRASAALAIPQAAQGGQHQPEAGKSREQRNFGYGAHPVGAIGLETEPAGT